MKQIIQDFFMDMLSQLFGTQQPRTGKLRLTRNALNRMHEHQLLTFEKLMTHLSISPTGNLASQRHRCMPKGVIERPVCDAVQPVGWREVQPVWPARGLPYTR